MSPRWAEVAGYGLYLYTAKDTNVHMSTSCEAAEIGTGRRWMPSPARYSEASCRRVTCASSETCSQSTGKRSSKPSTMPSRAAGLVDSERKEIDEYG